jgi:hypothetical protein
MEAVFNTIWRILRWQAWVIRLRNQAVLELKLSGGGNAFIFGRLEPTAPIQHWLQKSLTWFYTLFLFRVVLDHYRALALKALDMRLHAAAGNNNHFSGSGRSTFKGSSGGGTPLSLLSLSAEPLPEEDEEEEDDEVLFETSTLDVNEPSAITEKSRTD